MLTFTRAGDASDPGIVRSAKTRTDTICIVCGAGMVAGKEIVSLSLARGLRDAGWNPQFLTSQWGDGDFAGRLQRAGFSFRRLRLGFVSASLRVEPLLMTLDQMRYWPTLAYGYVRVVATTAPRVVIHTNWHHLLLLLPFLNPRRDILWLHDMLPTSWRYARMLATVATRVGRIVCVSHAVAQQVRALGVPQSHVTVVHSGLAPADPLQAPDEQAVLRLGIVGQIGPWKGHEDLLDALALLSGDNVGVALRVFGAGAASYVAFLKRRVVELNLFDHVEWCGYLNNQADIFRCIDVCIVPSRIEEPFGMSALEANAFGRPVICSSRGGLPEIVRNGETGRIVDTTRPDDLAEAIASYARRRDLVKVMGETARRRVQNEFSLKRFVDRFVQVIDSVAG